MKKTFLVIILIPMLLISCSTIDDQTYQGKKIYILETDIHDNRTILMSNGVYETIEDMYNDSDVVINGFIEDIVYYTDNDILFNEAIILKVSCVYKGDITKNILLSIFTSKKCINVELGESFLIHNDDSAKDRELPLVAKYYAKGAKTTPYSESIGKECVLFLVKGGTDIFADKKMRYPRKNGQSTVCLFSLISTLTLPENGQLFECRG